MRISISVFKVILVLAIMFQMACSDGNDDPGQAGATTCVLDSSNWDGCSFGP